MVREGSVILALICTTLFIQMSLAQAPRSKNIYASILQDSRNEPTPDGTFGYLYKTEDGIVSSARGGPNGVIQGGFSYTDPTGLKVNINYNAGARTVPTAVEPQERRPQAASRSYGNEIAARPRAPASVYRPEPRYYDEPIQDGQYQDAQYQDAQYQDAQYQDAQYQDTQYQQSAPRYITRRPIYRPQSIYRERISRPRENEIYDDNYRY